MVSMVVFMVFMFSIMGGMTVSICGISSSSWSMLTTREPRSSLKLVDTVERVEDRPQRVTGGCASKQCGSQ